MNLVHIVEVVLAFGLMIMLHEAGHFLVGRLCGVEVEEFAIGFGSTLISRKWGNTVYAIRSLPLGGFCKFKGGDISGESVKEMYARPPEPGDFLFVSWWKRIFVAFAGPATNYVLAILLVTFLFLVKGEIIPVEKPVLGFVPPGSQAEKAGLRKGDVLLKANSKDIQNLQTADDLFPDYGKSSLILVQRNGKTFETKIERPAKALSEWESSNNTLLRFLAALGFGPDAPPEPSFGISSFIPAVVGTAAMGQPARNAGLQDGDEIIGINGHKVTEWAEMTYFIRNTKDDPLQIEFLRDHKSHTVSIQRVFNGSFKAIGIMQAESKQEEIKKVSLSQAFGDAFTFGMRKSGEMLGGIWKLMTGKVSLKDNIGGPVTIMRMMYHQAAQGWEDFLSLVAIISLMLFLMNLLPIPVVDGGQIVIFLIEGIKRKPVSVRFQMVYQQAGFVLVIGLMLFAVFNDFKNLFLEIHNHIH